MAIEAVGLLDPVKQYLDGNGAPLAAGSIAFYQANSTTLQTVYSDNQLSVPLPNPVPLNAAGRTSTSICGVPIAVYLQQKTYDYQVFDANGVSIEGPFTVSGSQWPGQIQGQAILSPVANANGYTNRFTTTIAKAASGTHALFAGTRFDIPTISSGGSTLTEASTVYIEGAPGSGTTQNALHVAAGTTRLDGALIVQGQTLKRDRSVANFRLTLTSALPVTVNDVTAATTLYYTPYQGNLIALYTTALVWDVFVSAEISIALPAVMAKIYDVFIYAATDTTPTIELNAWTSDTVRATALTTQDGVLVKSGDPTRRFVGVMRTTGVAGQTESSKANRLLQNYYNRVRLPLQRNETTASWTYSTATIRQANGSASNQVAIVQGWPEDPIDLVLQGTADNATIINVSVGIGEDSTTAYTAGSFVSTVVTSGGLLNMNPRLVKVPVVGYHYYSWNEWSQATPTTTFYGAFAGGGGTITNGLSGSFAG